MRRPNTAYLSLLTAALPALVSALPDPERWAADHRDLIEQLVLLDFEALRPDLARLRPPGQPGRTPRDPVLVLRSLWLCVQLSGGRINLWVKRLRHDRMLQGLCGLASGEAVPGVGTHYRLLAAMLDGPDVPRGAVRRSALLRGSGGLFVRTLTAESSAVSTPAEGACAAALRDLDTRRAEPLDPQQGLTSLLAQWTARIGVKPLAEAGMLGDKRGIDLLIDGTVNRSHGSRYGHRADAGADEVPTPTQAESVPAAPGPEPCEKAQNVTRQRALHKGSGKAASGTPRRYSDPDATFRHSNATGQREFGHLGLVGAVRIGHLDVPLFTAIAPKHQGETPAMMSAVETTRKALLAEGVKTSFRTIVGDAGYDAAAFYRFATRRDMAPIVPLSGNAKPVSEDSIERDERGVPLCPGRAPMQKHGFQNGTIHYRCRAICNVRRDGGFAYEFQPDKCPLGRRCDDSKLGPSIRIKTEDEPRLNLPIPRDSELWNEIYDKRTAAERYNAHFHNTVRHRTYRRAHLWATAMFLHTLGRQMNALAAARRPELDEFWNAVRAGMATSIPAAA